jgi:NADH-quinone oxidoreductase subunit L
MTIPLRVLALGSVCVGFLGVPAALGFGAIPNLWEHWLEPVFEPAHHALGEVFAVPAPSHAMEYGLMAASVAIAVAGILLATQFYSWKPQIAESLRTGLASAHRVLTNKYYVDELYGAVFVRGLALGGGNLLHANDRLLVDGGDGEVRAGFGVNGVAWLARDIVASFSSLWDRWVVDGGLTKLPPLVLENMSYVFRAVQNGLVQQYALAMFIGVFLLITLALGAAWY